MQQRLHTFASKKFFVLPILVEKLIKAHPPYGEECNKILELDKYINGKNYDAKRKEKQLFVHTKTRSF